MVRRVAAIYAKQGMQVHLLYVFQRCNTRQARGALAGRAAHTTRPAAAARCCAPAAGRRRVPWVPASAAPHPAAGSAGSLRPPAREWMASKWLRPIACQGNPRPAGPTARRKCARRLCGARIGPLLPPPRPRARGVPLGRRSRAGSAWSGCNAPQIAAINRRGPNKASAPGPGLKRNGSRLLTRRIDSPAVDGPPCAPPAVNHEGSGSARQPITLQHQRALLLAIPGLRRPQGLPLPPLAAPGADGGSAAATEVSPDAHARPHATPPAVRGRRGLAAPAAAWHGTAGTGAPRRPRSPPHAPGCAPAGQ
jgi:hypothetical protein